MKNKSLAMLFIIFLGIGILIFWGRDWRWQQIRSTDPYSFVEYYSNAKSVIIYSMETNKVFLLQLSLLSHNSDLIDLEFPGDNNISSNGICIGESMWVISSNQVYLYDFEQRKWQGESIGQYDEIIYCKTLQDGTIDFLVREDSQYILIRDIEGKISNIDLPFFPNDIVQDKDGIIWLISDSEGLFYLDDGMNLRKLNDVNGLNLYFSSPDTIWISNLDGKYHLSTQEESGEIVEDNYWKVVTQTSDEIIWILKETGIEQKSQDHSEQINLPIGVNSVIYMKTILFQNQYYIFLSTNKGIYYLTLSLR